MDLKTKSTGYPGHKQAYGSYMQIINEIPPHNAFISAFAGHCAVLQYKKPAVSVDFGFELDRAVINDYWVPKGFTIRNECFLKYLEKHKLLSDKFFIYADPPYEREARKSTRDIYKYELTNEQHEQLSQLFHATTAVVAVSAYRSDFYDSLYKDWRVKEWKVQTRGGTCYEALYMNYAKPRQLHQYDMLGKDRTDRQRIKRKRMNLENKLRRLPDQERYLLIDAVQNFLSAEQKQSTTIAGKVPDSNTITAATS